MEFLTEQGYASTKEFLKAYLDGEVPVAQTETQLKVTGDVDALGEYLKASLEQIATEDYTLPVFEGSWQTGDGSRMGFRDLLRDTGLYVMRCRQMWQHRRMLMWMALRVWFRVVVYSHWQTAQIS